MSEIPDLEKLTARIGRLPAIAEQITGQIDELKKQLPTRDDVRFSASNLNSHKIDRAARDLEMFQAGFCAAQAGITSGRIPPLEYGVSYDRRVMVFEDIDPEI